jgi:uncharacterized membrane protein
MEDIMAETISGLSAPVGASGDQVESLKKLATVIYALQAGGFLFAYIPHIVAAVVIYQKKADATGTWLESHFRWQLRTFWYGLVWAALGFLFIITFVGMVIGLPIMIVNGIWIIYRVVKGWLRLNDGKQMYVTA